MNGDGRLRGFPRSYLFVPGDAEDKLEKAFTRGADAVIVDLEDAVAPGMKVRARSVVGAWLSSLGDGDSGAEIWLRVNPGRWVRRTSAPCSPRRFVAFACRRFRRLPTS